MPSELYILPRWNVLDDPANVSFAAPFYILYESFAAHLPEFFVSLQTERIFGNRALGSIWVAPLFIQAQIKSAWLTRDA